MTAHLFMRAFRHSRCTQNLVATLGCHQRTTRSFSSAFTCNDSTNDSPKLSLLGVPSDHGQPNTGVAAGPAAIRCAGICQRLAALGWDVHDAGDVRYPEKSLDPIGGDVDRAFAIGQGGFELSNKVEESVRSSDATLILGGDHSISIGSVAGILRATPDVGVIWCDAHCDINTPESSESKNIHGMVLAFLMKLFKAHGDGAYQWLQDVPILAPEQVVFIAARSVDKAERMVLKKLGITVYSMHSIDKYGIGKVLEMTLDQLDNRPLHLSYDIDALDPVLAPSTGTPVRGGLTYREAHFVAEAVADTSKLQSMDLVEVDPVLAEGGVDTVQMAVELAASALGARIL
eukprot:m.39471 g.39471  ORF g.39471 m.39471 type:complete len:345 (-) comp14717_c0_seq1:1369-2403(-)